MCVWWWWWGVGWVVVNCSCLSWSLGEICFATLLSLSLSLACCAAPEWDNLQFERREIRHRVYKQIVSYWVGFTFRVLYQLWWQGNSDEKCEVKRDVSVHNRARNCSQVKTNQRKRFMMRNFLKVPFGALSNF